MILFLVKIEFILKIIMESIENSKQNEYSDLAGSNNPQEQSTNNHTDLNNPHKLYSSWTFWYVSRKTKDHSIPYEERLKKFATFNTVEDFLNYYAFLKSASSIERNTDISLFREGYQPLWEKCPGSAFYFIRYKKHELEEDMDLKWEKLIFSLIGEQFDSKNILGATLSIRGRETIIELWFTYKGDDTLKNEILSKYIELLSIKNSKSVYFKDNSLSVEDKSTLKNVENVTISKRKFTSFY